MEKIMNDKIQNAILESIDTDSIIHVDVDVDIYSALEGVPIDGMAQLEHGEWDVWGNDEDAGGEWRLHIFIVGE